MTVIVAPRFYASSKTCSACGHVKDEMALSERVFRCEACGVVFDRDLAARNLAAVAGSSPETQNACGGEGSGQGSALVKPTPGKQEPSSRKLAAQAVGNKTP